MRLSQSGRAFALPGLCLGLCLLGSQARADLVLGFPSGLAGWTVSDPSLVTAASGLATIMESATAQETDLYLDFKIPTSALSLSFDLRQVNPDQDTVAPPDAFGASLLDPKTGNSLVSTVDANTDSFYIRDVAPGVTSGQAAAGVTTSPSADALPLHISLDLTGLGGTDARILFRLIAGGDFSDSSVVLSDVIVQTAGGSPVPEPGSLSLVLVGAGCLLGLGAYRRRSFTRSLRNAA